ncbi:MAG: hypothetical protein C5B49_08965 [Bdellovibrio sp.]|nr:MAG: hypothetical protein C5B49_08965 [Bdellovibrio sp.]
MPQSTSFTGSNDGWNGFEQNDPLDVTTRKAYDALHELAMKLHYVTCEGTKTPESFGAKMPGASPDESEARYTSSG